MHRTAKEFGINFLHFGVQFLSENIVFLYHYYQWRYSEGIDRHSHYPQQYGITEIVRDIAIKMLFV